MKKNLMGIWEKPKIWTLFTGIGEIGIVFEFIGDWTRLRCIELRVFDFFELDHDVGSRREKNMMGEV